MPDDGQQLHMKQDPAFERREWLVQRIGRWALCGFVAAAALGLFGHGPLSRATAGEPGSPLEAEYDRFVRVGAPTRVTIRGTAASGREWQLRLSRPYFAGVRLQQVTPRPAAMDIGRDDLVLRFTANPASARFTVILDLEPLGAGRQKATLRSGGATLAFTQFAYF